MSRIAAADVVVWAETFLYKKNDTINRARIKTAAGPHWLTIPVLTRGRKGQRIADVQIDSSHHWQRAHLKSIRVSYHNSPYYLFLAEEIVGLLRQKWINLNDLALQSAQLLCTKMGVPGAFIKSGELPVVRDRSERVIRWADACGCDAYLMPKKDAKYIDAAAIEKAGCRVTAIEFTYPRYHQLFGSFVTDLSALDLLLNEGEESKSVLGKNALVRQDEKYE